MSDSETEIFLQWATNSEYTVTLSSLYLPSYKESTQGA